jgi:hypothetical protein
MGKTDAHADPVTGTGIYVRDRIGLVDKRCSLAIGFR